MIKSDGFNTNGLTMDRSIVVKLGGATIEQDGVIEELAADLRDMPSVFPIIVHGGGSEIGRYLELLGKEFTFVEGLRVTDADMVEVVEMVLSGKVNKQLVSRFQHCGINALGVSGKDMGLLRAERYQKNGNDIGFVGEIVEVNTTLFDICASHRVTPVVSPISEGANGETYNVNADHAALDIARAVSCDDIGVHLRRGGHLPVRRPARAPSHPGTGRCAGRSGRDHGRDDSQGSLRPRMPVVRRPPCPHHRVAWPWDAAEGTVIRKQPVWYRGNHWMKGACMTTEEIIALEEEYIAPTYVRPARRV